MLSRMLKLSENELDISLLRPEFHHLSHKSSLFEKYKRMLLPKNDFDNPRAAIDINNDDQELIQSNTTSSLRHQTGKL